MFSGNKVDMRGGDDLNGRNIPYVMFGLELINVLYFLHPLSIIGPDLAAFLIILIFFFLGLNFSSFFFLVNQYFYFYFYFY